MERYIARLVFKDGRIKDRFGEWKNFPKEKEFIEIMFEWYREQLERVEIFRIKD